MLSLLGSLRGGSSFITRSLRFRSSASAFLSRPAVTVSTNTTWTYSAWIKRGALGAVSTLFSSGVSATQYSDLWFDAGTNTLRFQETNATNTYSIWTNQVFRDPSAWYHIVLAYDLSQATASDRIKLYINGSLVTSFSQAVYPPTSWSSYIGWTGSTQGTMIGRFTGGTDYFDGYMTEVNFVTGQALTPASFGAIDSSTGVWAPRPYSGTYGNNGFYLKFANTSSVAALGTDSSGNGNTWTVNNVSLTAGATYDSMIDVPVNYADGGNGRGNYVVLNPLDKVTTATLAAANLETTSAAAQNIIGSMSMDSGSWYWEVAYNAATASQLVGVYKTTATTASITPTTSVIGLRFNADTGALDYTVNGSTYTSIAAGLTGGGYFPYAGSLTNAKIIYANFGQRPFTYTPPAGFRALNTNNLPTPSIVNGANFMAATTYTGNAAARSLSNAVNSVSFQPDLVWIKSRTPGATNHALFDSTRGTTKYLSSDTTAAETTNANSLTAFNGDGFSLGTDTTIVNANANSYIAWQWRESITAGLDVVSYAGTGVNRTVAHNLGVAPAMIIVKRSQTGATSNWQVRHTSIAAANSIQLNSTNQAAAAATVWNSTAPTSSVFSLGTSTDVNASGISYVAYCFAEIAGFSKFGSYTGNGLADGPFVFCGFRPRWILIKNTNGIAAPGGNWILVDTARNTHNLTGTRLMPNSPVQEANDNGVDITAIGFKIRSGDGATNEGNAIMIFAAFAENPSKYALAR